MQIKILTLAFEKNIQGFNDELVNKFCLNKLVHKVEAQFFNLNNKFFWTIIIVYEEVVKQKEKIKIPLTESQKLLYQRLREWRRQKAEKLGFPVFLICNNYQLEEIVKNKTNTLEKLKNIKGIGPAKTQQYGKEILEIVKIFYSQKEKKNEQNK